MKKIFLLLLLAPLLHQCSSATDPLISNLQGTWVWVSSSGGFTGSTETPETTGQTRRLIITESTLTTITDNDLISERNYSLIEKESQIFGDIRQMLVSPNDIDRIVILDGNNLTLIMDCTDCITDGYVRQ